MHNYEQRSVELYEAIVTTENDVCVPAYYYFHDRHARAHIVASRCLCINRKWAVFAYVDASLAACARRKFMHEAWRPSSSSPYLDDLVAVNESTVALVLHTAQPCYDFMRFSGAVNAELCVDTLVDAMRQYLAYLLLSNNSSAV